MTMKTYYESPEVKIASLGTDGMIATSLGQDANLESLDLIEEEW